MIDSSLIAHGRHVSVFLADLIQKVCDFLRSSSRALSGEVGTGSPSENALTLE
jgi:hypothetical protein